MLGWFAMAHPSTNAEYSYAGEAESPDGKAYVIDAKNADGFAARLFIDQQTQLPLMLTYQGPQPRMDHDGGTRWRRGWPAGRAGRRPDPADDRRGTDEDARGHASAWRTWRRTRRRWSSLAIYFDDWREVDGVKFPHSMRRACPAARPARSGQSRKSRSTPGRREEVRDRELEDRAVTRSCSSRSRSWLR